MTRNINSVQVLFSSLLLAISFGLFAQNASAQQFITFNYPGAIDTFPLSINNRGEIVGSYDAAGSRNGFTLLNGQFTTINVDGAAQTSGYGINDSGDIVGSYTDGAGVQHGFLLSGATYSTIDFPGADSTVAEDINNSGEIVGYYENADSSIVNGFSLKAGVFTTIDFPGANFHTIPSHVNNFGVIAGVYLDGNSIEHGFVYKAGNFTAINFPGATSTVVDGINDSGELSGGSSSGSEFTYLNGVYTTIKFPVATEGGSYLTLNNSGQLAGFYEDDSTLYGFVSAIGPFAYIGNATSSDCCTLTVLDTSTNLVLTTIPIPGYGGEPFAISPDQTHIYVAAGSVVDVIDAASNSIVATIPGVGPNANAVTIAPNGKFGYTANYTADFSAGGVSVFNTATNSVVATVSLTFPAGGVNVTPDGAYLYVSGGGSTIAVINTSTNTVESTFSISVPPGQPNGNNGPVFIPNGSVGYIGQFAASVSPGTVTAVSIPSNTTVATIPVGTQPVINTITPSEPYLYVGNVGSNAISVIDTSSNTVIATVPVGNQPYSIALTPDGAFAYVGNLADSTVSVIQTSTNSVVATIPMASPFGILIPPASPTTQTITQPLSPTGLNTFNFGPHNFTVQYPAGISFSGVNMTVAATQNSQATFAQRVAATQFANATCIVYSGAGGNCVDYQVTCSTTSGSAISCPNESTPTISVKTSYDTNQSIINPGFLTTPIGTNEWTNIFDSFYLQRIDPTTKGRTTGFSEFVAVSLGATNSQGVGTFAFLPPLQQSDDRIFPVGTFIPVEFKLMSVAQPGTPVTDATAGITVTMISDATGNSTSNIILEKSPAFLYLGGRYVYLLNTRNYTPGVYNLTVYGNAFPAQQMQFTVPPSTSGVKLETTLQSLAFDSGANQYVAVLNVTNSSGVEANGVIVVLSALNFALTSTTLPYSLGDIGPGTSATVTLSYSAAAGKQGNPAALTALETFAGGAVPVFIAVRLP